MAITPQKRLNVYRKVYEFMVEHEWMYVDQIKGLCSTIRGVLGTMNGYPTDFLISDFPEIDVFEYSGGGWLWWWEVGSEDGYNERLFAVALAIAIVEDKIKLKNK